VLSLDTADVGILAGVCGGCLSTCDRMNVRLLLLYHARLDLQNHACFECVVKQQRSVASCCHVQLGEI
jgi:hypothetical protein